MKRIGLLLLIMMSATTGCAGGATAPSDNNQVIGPIILGANDATTAVTVGRTIVFDVEDPADWEVTAEPEGLVEISLGGTTGGAVFNPGVTATNPGEVRVTLRRTSTGETRVHEISISAP